ncbi:hypothetical protein K2X33_04950 [bacterium]|nr:hypothetical protein [bacterium]
MAFDEFRCAVVGNEPAGLWMLSALRKALEERGESGSFAWVSSAQPQQSLLFPSALAQSFGLPAGVSFSPEILSPDNSLRWTDECVARFVTVPAAPKEQTALDAFLRPAKEAKQAMACALTAHPQWLAYAQGLWKGLGRSSRLSAETLVHYSRYFTQLQSWNPYAAHVSDLHSFAFNEFENPVESFSVQNQRLTLRFRDQTEITSRHWIFNLDSRSLKSLLAGCPGLAQALGIGRDPLTYHALYPFEIDARPETVPAPVLPWSVYFDHTLIPDPMSEIWPFSLETDAQHKRLTFWATAPAEAGLEAISEQGSQALARAYRLFPFLEKGLVALPYALGMDTCHTPEQRRATSDFLQCRSREVYTHTALRSETRTPLASWLSPQIGCHLPYPIGPLLEAKAIVAKLVGRKKPLPLESASVNTSNP